MRPADLARLVALAAIWGASFLFMRIAAPVLGPLATADARMIIAGLILILWCAATRFDPQWRRWGRKYATVGVLNSALPFVLFSYAALSLPAGLSAVLNATSPIWGALAAAPLLGERLSGKRLVGLSLGVAGVVLISRPQGGAEFEALAIGAALGAAFLYGITGAYVKRFASEVPARGMAVGTQVMAGVLLLPFVALDPPTVMPSLGVAGAVLALGVFSGAVAYLLYFRLLVDVGPTRALTVTYLIPLFGILWGALFLGEALPATAFAGGALVITGTVFVLRG